MTDIDDYFKRNKLVYSLLSERFYGKLNYDICAICKSQLKEDQIIYYCLSCSALFHEEHLNEWLQKKDYCPVCKFPLKENKIDVNNNQRSNITKLLDCLIIENQSMMNKKNLLINYNQTQNFKTNKETKNKCCWCIAEVAQLGQRRRT